jgi:hypothetical protein
VIVFGTLASGFTASALGLKFNGLNVLQWNRKDASSWGPFTSSGVDLVSARNLFRLIYKVFLSGTVHGLMGMRERTANRVLESSHAYNIQLELYVYE